MLIERTGKNSDCPAFCRYYATCVIIIQCEHHLSERHFSEQWRPHRPIHNNQQRNICIKSVLRHLVNFPYYDGYYYYLTRQIPEPKATVS